MAYRELPTKRKIISSKLKEVGGNDSSKIQKIGDLSIIKRNKLGSGAFGVVFKGFYGFKPCAVKVLHELATEIQTDLPATGGGQEESIKAFKRECAFLKSFDHPNVVRHLATAQHPSSGQAILVTELMDCSLRNYLWPDNGQDISITRQLEVSICKDVASALAYIHGRSIVHRDLCGDNVLLKRVGPVPVAKISDFGMSRIIDCSTMSNTLTALGHRMGYLPPEAPLIEASRYDSSLDVFSFGVIMIQVVRRLETVKTPKDRSFHVAQIDDQHPLKPLILHCLHKNKDRRPLASSLQTECTKFKRMNAMRTTLQTTLTIRQRQIAQPLRMSPVPDTDSESDSDDEIVESASNISIQSSPYCGSLETSMTFSRTIHTLYAHDYDQSIDTDSD